MIGVDGLILIGLHHDIAIIGEWHAEVILVHHPACRTVRKGGSVPRHGVDAVRARIERRSPLVLCVVFLLCRYRRNIQGEVDLALCKGRGLRNATSSVDMVGSWVCVVV